MRWLLLCLLLLCPPGLCGCTPSPVTRENFDRIEVGMTQPEVEAILGPSTQDYQGVLTWKASETRLINVVLDDRKLVAEKGMEGL